MEYKVTISSASLKAKKTKRNEENGANADN